MNPDSGEGNSPVVESRPRRVLAILDWFLLVVGAAILACLVATSAQANIRADAVDYYAILQRLTPAEEKPVARNLPFLEQRSPGYPIAALGPYWLLSALVEPWVETEQVADASPSQAPAATPLPRVGPSVPSSGEGTGSESVLIPPISLFLRDLPFKDHYVPAEGSWFQWTLALALAATSYLFLFLGLAAGAWTLRHAFPAVHGISLPILSVFTSALFLQNVLATPLYATLTAYGLAALFALFFVRASASGSAARMLPDGFFLGFLVLTRLELAILAAAVAGLLLLRRQWGPAACLTLGAAWALAASELRQMRRTNGRTPTAGIAQHETRCSYVVPASLGETANIWTRVRHLGTRSLHFEYRLETERGLIATGRRGPVCYGWADGRSIAMAPALRAAILAYEPVFDTAVQQGVSL